jgi:acyl-CoA synthetase (AMP-forming)/AMP-acid ligase II/acyl dehydratase
MSRQTVDHLWGDLVVRRKGSGIPFLVYQPRPTSLRQVFETGSRWRDRDHLVQGQLRMSGTDVIRGVRAVAGLLAEKGVEPGDRVLLSGYNSLSWVSAFWGIIHVGAVAVLANPAWSDEEKQHALDLTNPALVVAKSEKAFGVGQTQFLELDRLPRGANTNGGSLERRGLDPVNNEDDPAIILFTSGTTGLPKGTTLAHRACIALQHTLMAVMNRLPHQLPDDFPRDVNLQTGPLFHIGGVQALIRSWLLGATMVFPTGPFEPFEVIDIIETEHVQRWGAVPTMISRVLAVPGIEDRDLSSVRSLTLGGSVVDPELVEQVRRCFPNAQNGVSQIYGSSEAGGTLTLASSRDLAERPGTVGQALPVAEIRIDSIDETGMGEIVFRTPSQMTGYWGQVSTEVADDGWIKSGDLGRLDSDGYLFVTGRSKDVIIRGGENIAAVNVERVLLTHEVIQEAAVLGLPDHDLGERVAAVVVLKPGQKVRVEELRAYAQDRLAKYELPTEWWLRYEELPVNGVGKVDKEHLRRVFPRMTLEELATVGKVNKKPDIKETQMVEAVLDQSMIERMRALIGTELRIGHSVNNEEVTRLAVERFADAIGDPNPLWRDRMVAERSPYGRPIAPPSFVMGCFSGLQFGWPGLGSFHSSTDITFYRPIFVGDTITASCRYEGFDEPRASSFASVTVRDQFLNTYRNQNGNVVAEVRWWVMNYMRQAAKAQLNEPPEDLPHPWSVEEVEAIEADVLSEEQRGGVIRWWDDTQVGDMLDVITKGPIGMTDEVAYVASGGPPIPRVAANGVSLRQYKRHPAWSFRDPYTMAQEPIYAVHYNPAAAQAMGVALQYDVGFQRQCWHVHLLTYWMGDAGWIMRAAAQYRGFVYHGDVLRLGGEVVGKRLDENQEALVDLRTWAINQRGTDVMPGSATVALPRRGSQGPVAMRVDQ